MHGGVSVAIVVAWGGLAAMGGIARDAAAAPRRARAEAPRIVVIECRPTCVVAEPVSSERVELRVRAFATRTEILQRNTPCGTPCYVTWRSVDDIRVRAGTGASAITFPVVAAARGREVAVAALPAPAAPAAPAAQDDTVADPRADPAAMDEATLAALAELAAAARAAAPEDWKIWGESALVPQRVDATIYHPDAIGYAPAPDGGLDDYFDDVVLLTGGGHTCTGIAIGPRHVLTAGHCVGVTTIEVARSATRADRFAVARALVPPEARTDAALLVSDRPLQLAVRPRSRALAEGAATGVVKIVGYGATDDAGRAGAGTKRQATLAVGAWRCTPARARRTGCVVDRELVIEGPSSDTCSGDSGGPALENVGGRWQLAAITSRGIPLGRGVCGGGGIYTSIGAIADWIEREVKAQ